MATKRSTAARKVYRGVKKRIAPRLSSGLARDRYTGGLPPQIKAGLAMRAVVAGRSLSWMLEEALIDHFGLERPEYQLSLRDAVRDGPNVIRMTPRTPARGQDGIRRAAGRVDRRHQRRKAR